MFRLQGGKAVSFIAAFEMDSQGMMSGCRNGAGTTVRGKIGVERLTGREVSSQEGIQNVE